MEEHNEEHDELEVTCEECQQAIDELNLLYDTMRYVLADMEMRKKIRKGCGDLVPGQLDEILAPQRGDFQRN